MEKYFSSCVLLSVISLFVYAIVASQRSASSRRREYSEAKIKLSKLEREVRMVPQ
jgi:hypothetical protein